MPYLLQFRPGQGKNLLEFVDGVKMHSANGHFFNIHTGLLAVSFYLLFGATLSLTFKKVTFYTPINVKPEGAGSRA